MNKQTIGLIMGPLLYALTIAFFHPEGLAPSARSVLAIALWMITWWVLEVIPIYLTALLPLLLFSLTNTLSFKDSLSPYFHSYIFLFFGGFILAIAMEKWKLHQRIAINIIYKVGSQLNLIVLGFMTATAFLSMWISNTATTVMMLPIGLAIITQMKDNPTTPENETSRFGTLLMLAIAYSASIGGIATLIGTPPNLVLARELQKMDGLEITFAQWMSIGLPVSITLLFSCWWYLTKIAFPFKQTRFPGGRKEITRQWRTLGAMSYEEKTVLIIFVITALAWICRSFLLNRFFPALNDTMIATIAAILLFLWPAGKEQNSNIVNWRDLIKIPWSILLLFGGGLALAKGFTDTGLAAWVSQQLLSIQEIPLLLLLVLVVVGINFLTEISSNLATVAIVLPILAILSKAIDIHPFLLMIGATFAASCAFMLPIATAPNAVVFGSGYIKMSEMAKTGLWLNIISICLISIISYFLLPYLWGLELDSFPVY